MEFASGNRWKHFRISWWCGLGHSSGSNLPALSKGYSFDRSFQILQHLESLALAYASDTEADRLQY
jgi:hypothetical protein